MFWHWPVPWRAAHTRMGCLLWARRAPQCLVATLGSLLEALFVLFLHLPNNSFFLRFSFTEGMVYNSPHSLSPTQKNPKVLSGKTFRNKWTQHTPLDSSYPVFGGFLKATLWLTAQAPHFFFWTLLGPEASQPTVPRTVAPHHLYVLL